MFSRTKIILAVVAILAIVVLTSMLLIKPKPKQSSTLPVNQFDKTQNSPLPSAPQKVSFNTEKRDQLIDKMNNKTKLSEEDQSVKNRLINSLNSQSGYLKETPEYRVEYIKSADLIQVELLDTNYSLAKAQATAWLEEQGFSNDGVCNLPVMFYLSATVKESLQDKDVIFNYLPEGC